MKEIEKDFGLFIENLREAGKNMNDSHYFQLPVTDKEDPIFRERVYCYELYHQMRNALDGTLPHKLDGEVDKRGHPIIPGNKKPDFIVHIPADMRWNLVVIEVKPVTVDDAALKEDLKKLKWLLDKGKYHRAIMLVYGDGKRDLPDKIKSEVINFSQTCENRILLAWHSGWGEKVEII